MSASLSDILTTLKNGVQGINALTSAIRNSISLGRGSMDTSYTTIYTVPKENTVLVATIDICNTSSSLQTVYVSFVPAGGTAGPSNALLYGFAIAANDTFQWNGEQILEAGDTIQCYASATDCTIMVSGSWG
jgi:hypothetical protein